MLFFTHINQEAKQINYLDSRAYTKDEINYYASVTHKLGIIDKGANYHEWLKNNGRNSDWIMTRAMDIGSQVHNLIDIFNRGIAISNLDKEGNELYSKEVWVQVDRYVDFYKSCRPEVLATECALVNDEHRYGGQIDLINFFDATRWLIDYKTGAEYPEHELQLAAYVIMWNANYPDQKIDKAGVLYLDSTTRGEDKKGKRIQGRGWKLEEVEDIEGAFQHYLNADHLWHWKNPNWKPLFLSLPTEYSKEKIDAEVKPATEQIF